MAEQYITIERYIETCERAAREGDKTFLTINAIKMIGVVKQIEREIQERQALRDRLAKVLDTVTK